MQPRILRTSAAFLLAGSFMLSAHAVGNGFYMGFMFGSATNNATPQEAIVDPTIVPPTTVIAKPHAQQWGSRIYAGNKFNKYAGLELGLTFFSDIHYDTGGVETDTSGSTQVGDIDLSAKVEMPIGWFDVYAKGGAAYVYVKNSGAFSPPDYTTIPYSAGSSTNKSKFAPTYGVGVDYLLSQNWLADLSWTRVQVGNTVSSIDLYALGISYHFVDKYCGQFLCDD